HARHRVVLEEVVKFVPPLSVVKPDRYRGPRNVGEDLGRGAASVAKAHPAVPGDIAIDDVDPALRIGGIAIEYFVNEVAVGIGYRAAGGPCRTVRNPYVELIVCR